MPTIDTPHNPTFSEGSRTPFRDAARRCTSRPIMITETFGRYKRFLYVKGNTEATAWPAACPPRVHGASLSAGIAVWQRGISPAGQIRREIGHPRRALNVCRI